MAKWADNPKNAFCYIETLKRKKKPSKVIEKFVNSSAAHLYETNTQLNIYIYIIIEYSQLMSL